MERLVSYIRSNPIIIVLVVLTVLFSGLSDSFLSVENISNILRQASLVGFVALGMCFVIIAGGIDLSVGSVVALSSVLVAGLAATLPPMVGIHMALLAGLGVGLANGMFVTAFGFQPIIVTLSSMAVVRGLAMAYSDSRPIFGTLPDQLFVLAEGSVFGVPTPAVLFIGASVVAAVFLSQTATGRQIYQVGGNEEAARLAGVNVARIKILTYAISGVLSAFAGLLLVARMQSGEAVRTGVGWELDAIAAAAIGGVSLQGGVGTVMGTVCGTLIIAMMANAFNLLGINPYWQRVVIGIVLAVAVAIYKSALVKRMLSRRRARAA